ncbi:alpha/beta-hydrolase [Aspergillus steynii IBT 23096]|uniref:Alpha/beta-hydrolase n=1 Tax=Aspergillus steynii IBT 23096 TaxID=1392250 RepID=A0A2I2G954_9EURO|nr:alpha/beta-hydrolase [Aspergillus steynii IBT 23096]PLB49417.1 alpha/beta-hydrolase [Aspergillus steynii IBT 23096]
MNPSGSEAMPPPERPQPIQFPPPDFKNYPFPALPAPSPEPRLQDPIFLPGANKLDRMTFESWGDGTDSTPLVMIQGFPFNSWIWSHVVLALRSRYTIFLWDLPIRSIPTIAGEDHTSLEFQAKNFARMLKGRFGNERVSIIAHGFGAAIALHAYMTHGVNYKFLVLVSPMVIPPWDRTPIFPLLRNKKYVSRLPCRLHGALVRESILSASCRGIDSVLLRLLSHQWTSEDGKKAFYKHIPDPSTNFRDSPQWVKIGDFPVVICYGECDGWIEEGRINELRSLIGNAGPVNVPLAGHLVMVDQPAALVEIILRSQRHYNSG